MSRGFWAARRPGWVAAGLLAALASLTILLFRERSGGNTATILSLTVSIGSLGVALWGLRPAPPMSRAARDLAGRVAQERGRVRQQALGMSGDARPAEVAFRPPRADDEPELVRWRSDGGAEHGTLKDVAGYYRSLERGRMVVLGQPGAGKTVLATQLTIDLVGSLPDGELQPGARPPVPVWLSLPSLDLGEPDSLARLTAEELAAQLDEWIAAQIWAIYQIPKPTARKLLAESWILPVLDGLDEMDSPSTDASNPRPLAAAVVRALNAGTGRRPVVLVCRRAEYGKLARSSAVGGQDPVLQDATQIVLQPLDVTAICGFLTKRFPGRQPGELDARWDSVRRALQDTIAGQRAESLAQVLSSPWQLFLAAAAYENDDSDPGELTSLPVGEIGEHLLGRLIPALTRSTPRPDGDCYQASEVHTWLRALAGHLESTSKKLGWSPADLRLERLWTIGGRKAVQRLSVLTTTMVIWAAFALVGLVWVAHNGRWYPGTLAGRVGLITTVVLVLLYCSYIASESNTSLNRLDLRLGSPAKRRQLASGLLGGLAIGLAFGLAAGLLGGLAGGLAFGLPLGLAYGLVSCLAVGLAVGLAGTFSLAEKPTSVMRQNMVYWLVLGLVSWLAFGLAFGLPLGLGDGLAIGLALGLASGLTYGLAVWIRYLIGCSLARRQGLLPRHVGRFLDWAYRANLLRMSGTAIQFRHRELQAWLAAPASVVPAPAIAGRAGAQD